MGLFDSPWHILIVVIVLVLLFGSAKLPKAAKSLGEAMRIFKSEAQKLNDDGTSKAAPPQFVQHELPTPAPAPKAVEDEKPSAAKAAELAAQAQQMAEQAQQMATQARSEGTTPASHSS
ncbi:MAG TPA: Sec-independent protein translocase subunit TatA [Streptosporangiaceae bacterium]|nr:Sec-independent protein translocase subunit TatA [Streptosporangiaceae bacterium]